MISAKYIIQRSDELGRYLVAAKDLKAGESILKDEPFVLGPNAETSLVCFNCYLPLISKFLVCKRCGIAPVCPGEGCPETYSDKWHNETECNTFKTLKTTKGLNPMKMVQNVGALMALRAALKYQTDRQAWEEFMELETHMEDRQKSSVCQYYKSIEEFIKSLDILESTNSGDLVQKICSAIDVNSFEVRGPLIPGIGCSELLRGIYLKAALLAHDCVANTHISVNNNNLLVCHASTDIKKGEIIYNNYTDPLKGTLLRQQHLMIGKYFKCVCERCKDVTELGTYLSSAICPDCKIGYVSKIADEDWLCNSCQKKFDQKHIGHIVRCCLEKFNVINKKDEKELKEYIKNVSKVLAPNHYLLLDAMQRLAGVLRDTINREPHPTKKRIRRKLQLCQTLLPIIEILCPGISRTKAITMYELHASIALLARKLFDSREITGTGYLDELMKAEIYLKKSLEMLFIEPGNSPEGEFCAKALGEYRALKDTMNAVLDSIHAEGTSYVNPAERESSAKISELNISV